MKIISRSKFSTKRKVISSKCCVLEKDIERSILQYLSTLQNVYTWKQNSVGVFDPKKGIYRMPNSPFIIRGVSDIIGIVSEGLCLTGDRHKTCGRLLAIEVKTPRRKTNLSDDQEHFISMIRKFGGIAFVATSIEDVKEIFTIEGII